MGAFILGVLAGWLAEWLFFTFWVKGKDTNSSSDCESLKLELSSKNDEVASLKAELNKVSSANSSAETIADVVKSATTKTSSTKVASSSKTEVKKTAPAKPAPITQAVEDKSATKTNEPKKAAVKKPAVKKATPKKEAPKKKVATKKAPVKKEPAKKAAVKNAPVKKAAKTKKGDDLTKLSGIGPRMASNLDELGISSFKDLAAMDDDILRDMLEASGARLNNNKEAMDSWNEQATLADKGDFAGLKKLQDELKK